MVGRLSIILQHKCLYAVTSFYRFLILKSMPCVVYGVKAQSAFKGIALQRFHLMPSTGTGTHCGGSVPKHAAEHSGTGIIRGPSNCFPDGSEKREMPMNKHSGV